MTRKPLTLTKAAGAPQPFEENKLRASLLRAGADAELVKRVVREVRRELRAGDSTEAIRRIALRILRREARHLAGRYNLKRAIMKLGPSGFPFERYWGAMLAQLGYQVSYDVMVAGRCVEHEVDVLAERDKTRRLAECKYHNAPGARTDLRVALYVYARSLDLKRNKPASVQRQRFELVTNTRFTSQAIRYARCVRLNLVGWDYPRGGCLRELIDRHALYPISCLSSLSVRDQKTLLSRNIVTCRSMIERPELLENIGMSARQIATVLKEATQLQRIGEVVKKGRAELAD